MDLDRGALANLDRRLLGGLGRDERFQMVRVPVSPARWSTWRRYCATVGISMGRAFMALVDRELARVAETSGDDSPVLAQRIQEQLASQEAALANREQAVASDEEKLRSRGEHLRRWEAELQATALRIEGASKLAAQNRDRTPKVGRNDRCLCGSGLKYKHCHGIAARPPSVVPISRTAGADSAAIG